MLIYIGQGYQREHIKGEHCNDELVKAVYSFSKGVDRMDLVFDRYLENNIKTQTREGRGKGMRISVWKDTPL